MLKIGDSHYSLRYHGAQIWTVDNETALVPRQKWELIIHTIGNNNNNLNGVFKM